MTAHLRQEDGSAGKVHPHPEQPGASGAWKAPVDLTMQAAFKVTEREMTAKHGRLKRTANLKQTFGGPGVALPRR
jgi:hypothetical protein